jgi:hypothetical protein
MYICIYVYIYIYIYIHIYIYNDIRVCVNGDTRNRQYTVRVCHDVITRFVLSTVYSFHSSAHRVAYLTQASLRPVIIDHATDTCGIRLPATPSQWVSRW